MNLKTPNARKLHDAEIAEVMSEITEDSYPGQRMLSADDMELSFDGERFSVADTLDSLLK